jgi:uncharacterized protein DUF927
MGNGNKSQPVYDYEAMFEALRNGPLEGWVKLGKDNAGNPSFREKRPLGKNTSSICVSVLGEYDQSQKSKLRSLPELAKDYGINLDRFRLIPRQKTISSKTEVSEEERDTAKEAMDDWTTGKETKKVLAIVQKHLAETRGIPEKVLTTDFLKGVPIRVYIGPSRKNKKKTIHKYMIPVFTPDGNRIDNVIHQVFLDTKTNEKYFKGQLGSYDEEVKERGLLLGSSKRKKLTIFEGFEGGLAYLCNKHPKLNAQILITFGTGGFAHIDGFLKGKTADLILDPDNGIDKKPHKRYSAMVASLKLEDKVDRYVSELHGYSDADDAAKAGFFKEWEKSLRLVPLSECHAANYYREIKKDKLEIQDKEIKEFTSILKSAFESHPEIVLVKEYYNRLLYEIHERSPGYYEEILQAAKSANIYKTTLKNIVAVEKRIAKKTKKTENSEYLDAEYTSEYIEKDNRFYCWEFGFYRQISNFTARIIRQVSIYDGAEKVKIFSIAGCLENDVPLSEIEIPAKEFQKMNWVTDMWGGEPNIFARRKDYVRSAIQSVSEEIETKDVLGFTGWTKKDGQWIYVHSNGAIGQNGLHKDIDVELGNLKNYALPAPKPLVDKKPIADAIKTVLDAFFLKLPDRITVPLLSSVFRAPLSHCLPCDFSVFYYGETGTKKSVITSLALNFYGSSFDWRNLPTGWHSTANFLEKFSFLAKDALLVIDDFNPKGADAKQLHRKAENVLRSQANKTARGRMRPDGSLRPSYVPRGLLMSSGEDVPIGQSLRGRICTIEVTDKDTNNDNITDLQGLGNSGLFADVMSLYLQWLSQKMDILPDILREREIELRKKASQKGHSRTPGITASLYIGFEMFLRFADDFGAVPHKDDLKKIAWRTLTELSEEQTIYLNEEDETQRFLSLFKSALESKSAHVEPITRLSPENLCSFGYEDIGYKFNGGEYKNNNPKIGWIDKEQVYLIPDMVWSVIQELAKKQGSPIGASRQTVFKRLANKNIAVTAIESGKIRYTPKKAIKGSRNRYLIIPMTFVFPDNIQEEIKN